VCCAACAWRACARRGAQLTADGCSNAACLARAAARAPGRLHAWQHMAKRLMCARAGL
jgi:hypothetical protein